MTTKQINEIDIALQNLKESFDLRKCKCEMEEQHISFCSVKCLHKVKDGALSAIYESDIRKPYIKWATVDDINNLPNDVEEVIIGVLERNDCSTISGCVESVTTGYKLSKQLVNNLPSRLDCLTIIISEVPEEDIRVPFGCNLFVRRTYANPIYENQYDVICHLFEFRREYIKTVHPDIHPRNKTIDWSNRMRDLDTLD